MLKNDFSVSFCQSSKIKDQNELPLMNRVNAINYSVIVFTVSLQNFCLYKESVSQLVGLLTGVT